MFLKKLIDVFSSKRFNTNSYSKKNELARADRLVSEGNKLEDAGKYSEALRLYDQAITVAPLNPRAYINKGVALHSRGDVDLAVEAYERALECDSQNPIAHFNIGNIWQEKMDLERALKSYYKALSADPEFLPALVARGNVLGDLGRHDEARASYERALNINPEYVEVRRNLVFSLMNLSRPLEALKNIKKIIENNPNSTPDHILLANVQRENGDFDGALQTLKRARVVAPRSPEVCSYLCFVLQHQHDVALDELMQTHWEFGRLVDQEGGDRTSKTENREERRQLNIGVVSADLRGHSVVNFFEPIYRVLTETPGFRIFVYNNYDGEDEVTRRLKGKSSSWVNVSKMNGEDFRNRVRMDEIDVLIDLSGHTPGNRLEEFGKRIAPLQLSWIGYPGTTGMRSMDYYIADRHFLPYGQFENQFSEKIIRLPAMAPFSTVDDLPDVNTLPALLNGHVTFGSFNRVEKLNGAVIALWSRLLNALPTARMVVGAIPDDWVLNDIASKFSSFGVELSRLEFRKKTGTIEYMRMHWDVDVCLDTFPYGGSTTTFHALSMGVPTLTVTGKTPMACAGRAILSALNMADDFVAFSESDFVAKGVSLGNHLQELAALRSGLRGRLFGADLMKAELVGKAFAAGVRYAWTRWCKGQAPLDFEVVERDGEFDILC